MYKTAARIVSWLLGESLLEILKVVVLAVLFAFLFRTFLYEPFHIPSESMMPSLQVGDYLLVSKYSYGYSHMSSPVPLPGIPGRLFGSQPRRGDIAVFRLPRDPDVDYVKRIIGLPGDRIRIRGGVVHLNGAPLGQEPGGFFTYYSTFGSRRTVPVLRERLPSGRSYPVLDLTRDGELDNTGEFVVPAGHVFVMGDNRDNSVDSRVSPARHGVGMVPVENLLGQVSVVVFSVRNGARLWEFWNWWRSFRSDRFFLFPQALRQEKEGVMAARGPRDERETDGETGAADDGELRPAMRALDYSFRDVSLLREALSHPGLSPGEREGPNYDRLEFLGDRVIALLAAEDLFHRHPGADAGNLARRLNTVVRADSLADAARKCALGSWLRMTRADRERGEAERTGSLSDAFEAVTAAIYLDGGLGAARRFFLRHCDVALALPDSDARDPKSALQEWGQGRGLPLPDYTLCERTGPDHRPVFTSEVSLPGIGSARGTAGSKRRAEEAAARALLDIIGRESLL